MDKKQINTLVEEIVAEIATNNGLTEAEARTFVGVALRTNKVAFIKSVSIPKLSFGTPEAAPAA